MANNWHIDRESNYYEVLGFKSTHVSEEEVLRKYEELNNQFNPSTNTDPDNLKKFKKIQDAYNCIKSF
jgi:curved DNA-binding protein CbpA